MIFGEKLRFANGLKKECIKKLGDTARNFSIKSLSVVCKILSKQQPIEQLLVYTDALVVYTYKVQKSIYADKQIKCERRRQFCCLKTSTKNLIC